MNLVIVCVACFLASMAAGAGVAWMRARNAPPASHSVSADSTLALEKGADPAHEAAAPTAPPAPPAAGPHVEPASPEKIAAALQAHAAVAGAPAPDTHGRPPGAGEPSPVPTADQARVAKILANMKPADAAAILGHLSDEQVEAILRALGPRAVAALLAAVPVERAARLSSRLMTVSAEDER